jgi:hypothetical protein
MFSMIGLSVIGLFLSAGLAYFYFRQLISLWAVGLLELRLLRAGTLTGWHRPILRVLTSLLLLYLLLLMLSDIAFYSFGVLKLKAISSAGASLGDSGLSWPSTDLSL